MTTEPILRAHVPGRFGPYGGRYVPETLMVPLYELERAYEQAQTDASFQSEFYKLLKNFAGRPTPLQFASRLTAKLGGPRIYLKREDLLHTGAHKINNAIGQGLLAVKMGKPRIVAETGAGQHGVASATVAAHHSPATAGRSSGGAGPAPARSRKNGECRKKLGRQNLLDRPLAIGYAWDGAFPGAARWPDGPPALSRPATSICRP